MNSYKELEVWQKAMELVTCVYTLTQTFPALERFGLKSQIQRAAVSIPANIAEGWGRGTRKEYIQFLSIARGSLMELETHLLIAQRLNYLSEDQTNTLLPEVERIGKMLNRLIRSLRS